MTGPRGASPLISLDSRSWPDSCYLSVCSDLEALGRCSQGNSKETKMRKLLLATAAALGLAASGGVAHATLTYTIWTGDFGGSNFHSAQPPVPTTNHLVTFTDSGNPINFVNNGPDTPDGSDNTFADFFTTPVLAECNAANSACGGTIMSTTDNTTDDSTFIEITGLTALGGAEITINHDDGGTVFEGATQICGNPAESAVNAEACTIPGSGPQALTVYYTEDNGAPAILQVSVPEPISLAIFGAGLVGLGLARRRKNA